MGKISPPRKSALNALRRVDANANLRTGRKEKFQGPQDLKTYLDSQPMFTHVTPSRGRLRQESLGQKQAPRKRKAEKTEKTVTRDILGNVWLGDDGGKGFRWCDRELRDGGRVLHTVWEGDDE